MYTARSFDRLIGMDGFSNELLSSHFKLYEGYVENTNQLLADLRELRNAKKAGSPAFAELRRRLGWEWNGMRLHEYYFENLGGDGHLRDRSALGTRLQRSFGGYDAWLDDFKCTASMRGIGWAILYQDGVSGDLLNCWIEEHDGGHPAGAHPLLVLDAFEHAYQPDYGLKRPEYLEAFFANLRWDAVESRLK